MNTIGEKLQDFAHHDSPNPYKRNNNYNDEFIKARQEQRIDSRIDNRIDSRIDDRIDNRVDTRPSGSDNDETFVKGDTPPREKDEDYVVRIMM